MSELTLPIKLLVDVGVDYTPKFLGREDFTQLCIIGTSENTRGNPAGVYNSIEGVGEHYADDTNEYKVAERLFAQTPRPKSVLIATVDAGEVSA